MQDEKTGLFDSHPSDTDRIQAGQADGSRGCFRNGRLPRELPASLLFQRFEEISKALTRQFYENALSQPISPRILHSVDKLLERQNLQIEAGKALARYFQTQIPLLRPLPIASQSANAPDDPRKWSPN